MDITILLTLLHPTRDLPQTLLADPLDAMPLASVDLGFLRSRTRLAVLHKSPRMLSQL
jgi:hypothetical protein